MLRRSGVSGIGEGDMKAACGSMNLFSGKALKK